MKNIVFFVFGLWVAAFATASAQAKEALAIAVEDNSAVITLTLPDVSPNKVFIVTNPERLVVDVPSVAKMKTVHLPSDYRGKLIKDVRYGRFSAKSDRFVFDLTLPVEVVSVNAKSSRLTITIRPTGKPAKEAAVEKTPEKIKPARLTSNEISAAGTKTKETKTPSKILAEPVAEPPLKKKPREKPLVVIDPGHGGVDPGTTGPHGLNEKELVLEYAQALRARLIKSGKYRVELTRSNDRFIMLRQRIKIARDKKAALFISLHADSAPEASARGLSVYTLSEKASDEEAAALAARENKADVLAGIDLSEERQDVADILISLAQRDTSNRSSQLADLIVYSLDGKVRLLSNSHRFAGFAVLKAPDIPSVLVELGFLSHSQEEKQLTNSTYRLTVVNGIAAGIDSYFAQNEFVQNE
jgi:N-acetylmuramoyl-L-alanine amidase